MRIMIVTDQFSPMVGGIPSVTRSLAEGLAGRGQEVMIAAPGSRDLEERLSPAGVTVYRCRSFRWIPYEGQRIAMLPIRRLRGLMDACAPDIVHVHSILVLGAIARTLATRARRPLIATHHFLPANVQPSLMSRRIPRTLLEGAIYAYMFRFYSRCDFVTAPTRTALDPLIARGLRPPSMPISNGVDLARFSPGKGDGEVRERFGLPSDRPLVLYLNRLSVEKRPEAVLEAARLMRGPAHIAMAGTGPLSTWLRSRAKRLRIDDRITFLGFVPDEALDSLYRAADVFVIPSEAELQSLATMEAMACALPVVSANAQALPELVHHEENGFLFPPGDVRALAGYLDALAADPSLRARMGARSVELIRPHDRELVLNDWEKLYSDVRSCYRFRAKKSPTSR